MAEQLTEDQREASEYVLNWYGVEGYPPPGGFTYLIIQAYTKADPGNKRRLRRGFPEIAEAMDIVNSGFDGLKNLEARLK